MNSIYLPLHYGKAPYWLLNRMKKLARPILTLIIQEYGEKEVINRLSDPIFFQSFSNVLGFDWNSSGSTTVLTGVLKSVLNTDEFDLRIAGGKGGNALKTVEEIEKFASELGIGERKRVELIRASRLSAKLDSAALQDGYDLYHHTIVFTRKHFVVIQQGMNESLRMARRYHLKDISIVEPHSGIITQRFENSVMDLTAENSGEARKTILDIVNDGTYRFDFSKVLSMVKYRESLVPKRVDWKALEKAYSLQPDRFEDLLLVRGVGKGAIRALALIAELVYDAEYSKKDPAKFSFALGGKDGVPFPVNRRDYDDVIEFMEEAVRQAELSDFEKRSLLERLAKLSLSRSKTR
ncbi:DUF763 domain-containing protein [Geoglobus acetivorans]